ISFILEDKDKPGVLWAGSYQDGLRRFADGKWFSFKNIDGFTAKLITQMKEDENGYFWITGDKGIIRVSKNALARRAEGKSDWVDSSVFNLNDGMLNTECSWSTLNTIIKTTSGDYWFATKEGICTVNPANIKIDTHPPNVLLETVKVNRKPLEPREATHRFEEVRELVFQYTAPSPTYPARFRYRLEGVDKNWQTPAPAAVREAVYYDLRPGKYRFQVIACNRYGVWNTEGAAFDFAITAPFHTAVWFWGLICIVLAVCFFFLVKWFKKRYTPVATEQTPQPSQRPELDRAQSQKVLLKLTLLMEQEKRYRDSNLSIAKLAKELYVSVHFLSQLINEKTQKNFFDFINEYRIEEIKEQLKDPSQAKRPVLEIAFDSGFGTKSSFNRYFKKLTGQTPSQYRKKHS
ncbi:MAG: helix-turn-helix domain-containing protein, partial [bacterium]|nr:helix-turn-helix domain-containing protein [bacterium]